MSRDRGDGGRTGPSGSLWIWEPLTWTKGQQEEEDVGRKRQTDERGGGRKEEFLVLGGVSVAPWPRVDRLRQK